MAGRNDDRPKGRMTPAEARAERLAAELRSNLARPLLLQVCPWRMAAVLLLAQLSELCTSRLAY